MKHEFLVLANRLPVRKVGSGWQLSPGGLVSALIPVVVRRKGCWVGWSGATGRAPRPFTFEGFHLHPVRLSRKELDEFYYGFSNGSLWPLYHDAIRPSEYHRTWWGTYREVNRRFARIAAELAARGAQVWVHDYHLQLVPAMLRELRPDLRIGFFLHVPFPPQELFAQLPPRREILMGILGSDLAGFQTKRDLRNFSTLARRYAEARGDSRQLKVRGRKMQLGAFPVSIDVKHFEELAVSEKVREVAEGFRGQLGSRRILLGVDRLDYTKGIDIRLKAFQELLASRRISARDCVFVQVAVPSRERVGQYKDLKQRIEMLVGRINGDFGEVGWAPVHYLHRSLDQGELAALYRLADVMVVTPLRDGMNLVAKEYVACRIDDDGVLILSEFTGSAEELRRAVLVNPHDVDGLSNSIHYALHLPESQARRRMRSLRTRLRRSDIFDWGQSFLRSLEGR